jgi:hypothetical protein
MNRECTFFPVANGAFSKIDHILGCKASLGKDKKTEITPVSYQTIIE